MPIVGRLNYSTPNRLQIDINSKKILLNVIKPEN